MTAVAWSIMFVGVMFYATHYEDKLKQNGDYDFVGKFMMFAFCVLILCTIRELFK